VSRNFVVLIQHSTPLYRCMVNGRLVEQGTHEELMAKAEHGEYSKLYDIQAQAFTPSET